MLSTENAPTMCPLCGEEMPVYQTRKREDGVVLRRRRCPQCEEKVETGEFLMRRLPKKKKRCRKI